MEASVIPFGPGGLSFLGLYFLILVAIGWYGSKARESHSLKDFYLGGKGIGWWVLLLTLFATQYSGNTMFGFSGKAYRVGFSWITSVHFMTAIIVGYLIYAPRLHPLGKTHGFITPTDYLNHRFHHLGINLIAPCVMILALGNFLLAQLMAMGRALQGLTTLPDNQAYIIGVILLAIIMLIYETLGGFRAVAWTDVIQGVILIFGFGALVYLIWAHYGGLTAATQTLLESSENSTREKVLPPNSLGTVRWFSYLVLFGLGASLYPQAIQRIYAARDSRSLRTSLAAMAFLPIATAWVAVMIGITGAAHHPNLSDIQSDQILTIICRDIQQSSLFGYSLVVVLFAAILGALMSTADSCMLTLSSIVTKDFYLRYLNPQASEPTLTTLGKILSWLVVGALSGLAIYMNALPTKPTLVKLLDLKFDMLVQLAPAFMLGLHWQRLSGHAVFIGIIAGLVITFGLYLTGWGGSTGIHYGLFGLAGNLMCALSLSCLTVRDKESSLDV